jgi:diguanylate cyclase (GGDEF)-like protein
MNMTARGERALLGRALRTIRLVRRAGLSADPYFFYTATLAPVVLAVAIIARRPGELAAALALSAAAIAAQTLLGILERRRRLGGHVGWHIVRLLVPLLFVAIANRSIGGSAFPLLALYIPVVAGAAAAGTIEGAVAAGVAAFALLLPEIGDLGSTSAIALRGVTLAGVTIVLAFGTRRIVAALESAVVTARRSAIAVRHRGRQIEALDAVGRLLAGGGPTPELLGQVLTVVADRFGYPFLSVYLGDAREIRLAAQVGFDAPIPSFSADRGIAGRVLRTRQMAFVPNVHEDPEYVDPPPDAESLISAPLLVGGELVGILNVETANGRRLDRTDRSLVAIIAARIAGAIELGRDRQALAARAELFHDIERFGRDVSGSLAIDALAATIVDAVGRVVRADTLAVTLLDRGDGRYVVRGARGVPDEVIGREIKPGEGLAGRAIRDRALVIDDAMDVSRYPASVRDLEVPALSHGAGVPLVRDGVVVGAFTIGRADGDGFTDLELEGLALLAGSAALAVANAFLHADVAELAVRDPLTGLFNRRHFDEALERMLAARRRERLSGWRPLSAITFDLDHFGAFNKEHGHQVGDLVLRAFAEVLRERFRATDLVARLGGEEFIVVLDGADLAQAVMAADEVRRLLAARTVEVDDRRLRMTVSAGCAELDATDPSRESLLRTADVALFMAKRAGRDRVVAA